MQFQERGTKTLVHGEKGEMLHSTGRLWIDPATGRRNVGSRRLSLRNRTECGTNVTAPSDLKRIYTACVARDQRLPITFTSGSHPLDFFAATMRTPGDELAMVATMRGETAAVVKSLTNDILVPADAEMKIGRAHV